MTPIEYAAIAAPRRAGGKLSIRMAWAIGWSAPPPAPWTTRAATSMPRLNAAPHAADAVVKIRMQAIRNRLRPKKPESQADAGRMIALETR